MFEDTCLQYYLRNINLHVFQIHIYIISLSYTKSTFYRYKCKYYES